MSYDDFDDNEHEPTRKLAKEIEKLLKSEPLDAMLRCQSEYRSQEVGHVKIVRLLIISGYRFGLEAKHDEDLLKEFYREEFFKVRKQKVKAKDILRNTMCYLVGSLSGPKYERACNYTRALEKFFEREAPADEVGEKLADKGVEWLYREAVEERKSEKAKGDADLGDDEDANDDDDRQEDKEDGDQPKEPKHKGGPGSKSSGEGKRSAAAKRTGSGKSKKVSDSDGDLKPPARATPGQLDLTKHLAVEMKAHDLEALLGLAVGGEAQITVERVAQIGPWKRIVAVKVEIDDSDL